jgi:hypothetical protein
MQCATEPEVLASNSHWQCRWTLLTLQDHTGLAVALCYWPSTVKYSH